MHKVQGFRVYGPQPRFEGSRPEGVHGVGPSDPGVGFRASGLGLKTPHLFLILGLESETTDFNS